MVHFCPPLYMLWGRWSAGMGHEKSEPAILAIHLENWREPTAWLWLREPEQRPRGTLERLSSVLEHSVLHLQTKGELLQMCQIQEEGTFSLGPYFGLVSYVVCLPPQFEWQLVVWLYSTELCSHRISMTLTTFQKCIGLELKISALREFMLWWWPSLLISFHPHPAYSSLSWAKYLFPCTPTRQNTDEACLPGSGFWSRVWGAGSWTLLLRFSHGCFEMRLGVF